MKNYNVKYDVNQEVYIINKKAIYKSRIDKIRITEQQPHEVFNGSKQQEEDAKTGISIQYLVVVDIISYGERKPQSQRIEYEWYNQQDVWGTRDEVIAQIN